MFTDTQGERAGVIQCLSAWRRLSTMVVALSLGLMAAQANAADAADAGEAAAPVASYEAGVHYEALLVPVAQVDPERIEVVEMFSYLCVHCFNFDATVAEWAKRNPADVAFRREPAVFNRSWATLAQGFYTAEALGISEKTHDVLFESIHQQNMNLADPDLLHQVLAEHGEVSKERVAKVFNSFSVRSKVEQANTRGRQYRIQAVPSMIVAGKYRVEGRMAGSNIGMLRIVDFLVEKERTERAAAAAAAASVSSAAGAAAQ